MDSAAWDERYRSSDLIWGDEPNRFVRQLCERLPIGHALDLGCGEGRNALWLSRLGWYVTGIDYSPVAVQRAVELTLRQPASVREQVSWRVADVTAAPPRARSVDLVLISYVHLPPPQRHGLLLGAARALKPDGHVVLVGHDRRNLAEGVGGPRDADLLYDPAEVAGTLLAEGLVVELAETVQRSSPQGTAIDCLVHARVPADVV